jgi:amino acid adenylation domain-containing protein
MLRDWNDTALDYDRTACVHQLFSQQVQRTPERIALEYGAERWTYAALDQAANRLARLLRQNGVGPETLVGICLERSASMVLAVLAVWKAGGAYVPLDPAFPANRLDYMLSDSRLGVVISQTALRERLSLSGQQVIYLDQEQTQAQIAALSPEALDCAQSPEALAYVLYTSGSTGKPKGVQICQGSVVNFLTSMRITPGISCEDVLLSVTSLSFDISVLEIWLPLLNGARLVIAGQAVAADGQRLASEIDACGATLMQATPATWQMLILAGWKGRKGLKMLCGGEALPGALAERLLGLGGELWNMYGPTETTIWSSTTQVLPGAPIRLGPPIANTSFYILDSYRQPVPVGVAGDLYIGGDGLARGYLGQPELTQEKFVQMDLVPIGSRRIYQTGDLARWQPDGLLEFLGRNDTQVKIRGYRIETEEIETVLKRHSQVADAAVIAWQDSAMEKRLVAYLVARDGDEVPGTDLRRYLGQNLPPYMVPSFFVYLQSLPLTPNRKVDRKALPTPQMDSGSLAPAFVPPDTGLETELTAIWEEVLEARPVGVCDNFFERGGTSLMAIRLVAEVEKRLDRVVPLTLLFEEGTIRHMAAWISGNKPGRAWDVLIPLQPLGRRRPLFVVHPLDGDVSGFNLWSPVMEMDQPLYGLRAVGIDGISQPLETIQAMASHYIEAIRSIQPQGPYQIAGYCSGSLIAFEMARQLEVSGDLADPLLLINWAPPGSGYFRPPYRPTEWPRFLRNLPAWVADIARLSPEEINVRLRVHLPWLFPGTYHEPPLPIGEGAAFHLMMTPEELRGPLLKYYQTMDAAFRAYQMADYAGPATILRTRRQPLFCNFAPTLGWERYIHGKLTLVETPGSNTTILTPSYATDFAEVLKRCLRA